MFKKILSKVILLSSIVIFANITVKADDVAITATPSSAKIYVNGRMMGTGNLIVSIKKNECVTIEVKEEGYFSEVRTYCRRRGMTAPPATDFFNLKQDENLIPAIVAVTTSPQTAKIYVNGVVMGAGSLNVTVPNNDCVNIEVKELGYITLTTNYCKRKGISTPPKSEYFKMEQDESFTSSVEVDNANIDIPLEVRKDRTKEEAWKIIVSTILGKFDVLEMNDEKSGYLRTAWVGRTSTRIGGSTVRMRVIVKMASEDPLTYKIKFISDIAYSSGVSYSSDEKFVPFSRIWKKYDGFLDEIITKLKN
jgi:hypothetical protein